MRYTTSYRSCSALLLTILFAGWVQVHGHHRASHDKCEEYRSWASSNLANCNRPKPLILLDPIRVGDYPHQAFFGWKEQDNPQTFEFLSSGSLISERYLLTAAHSTRYQQKPPDVVRFGVVDLGAEDQSHTDYEVEEVIVHPNYTARLAYNDIALVKLRDPVSFSEDIRPACLWDSLEMNFTSVVTTAFGSRGYDGLPGQLEKHNMDVIGNSQCQKALVNIRKLRDGVMDHQLCLAHTDRRHHASIGNSGSPAQIKLDPKDCFAYIVGISSHGFGAAGIPDIYTRVASFVEWIEEIVWH
ncbi:serine protease snake-like [Aedes albopictus]|uniref:Peptidase S1 domain-containing protein n=1 Tax=Aedes albopictus TaxID=7160 RepID=A0ABM1Y4A7_AEDAL|nr:serine protease snake-like [Aedes albopictus]